jgi:hypothetical protein
MPIAQSCYVRIDAGAAIKFFNTVGQDLVLCLHRDIIRVLVLTIKAGKYYE